MSQFNPPPPPPPPPPYQPIPPTQPGLLGIPAQATKWPMIVGVIAIVLGALSAVGNLCGVFSPVLQSSVVSMLPADVQEEAKGDPRMVPWMVGGSAIWLLMAVVQIVGGSGLAKRARWSPKLLRTWAILAIIASAAWTLLMFQMEAVKPPTVVVATSGPAASMPTSLPAQVEKTMLAVGMCMGLGYSCAFPVFILIWLAREPIRDEIRTWQASPT